MDRGCLVKGCLALAKWVPSVTVSIGDNKFKLDFDIPVCDDDMHNLKLVDVVPDNVLKVIQNMFQSSLLHPPTRDNMVLTWEVDIPKTVQLVDTKGKSIGKVAVQKR